MCWSRDTGVTMVGFGQLHAALFFWARFATLEPIYMWIDLWTAIMFTIRTVWYFLMVADDNSEQSKKDYYECNKITCFGLVATAITTIVCKWLEWGHVPIWPLITWCLWAGFQAYHWFILRSNANMTESWGRYVDVNEMLVKKNDDHDEYSVNKI